MSGPFTLHSYEPAKARRLRQGVPPRAGALVDFIEAGEPRLLAFNEYSNAERTEVTVVQVHPDAAQ